MSKENTLKSSKFAECYNELRSNKKLRYELSKLSGSKFKSKLMEIFPSIKITGHFTRTVKSILKENNPTSQQSPTDKDKFDLPNKGINDKEVPLDKEDDSSENKNDDNDKSKDDKEVPPHASNEGKENSNNSSDSLSLTANNNLNKNAGVIIGKENVKSIDEMTTEINTLKKEVQNKNSDIDSLKSQLNSAHEKIRSLSMSNEDKQKQILEIQTNYSSIDDYDLKMNSFMVHDLVNSYVDSGLINTASLCKSVTNVAKYCVKKAVSEAIFNYKTKC